MKTIKINRLDQDFNQTLGVCTVHDGDKPLFSSISLERGWRNNENNVSCIPKGTYPVVLEYSNRFNKELWEIKNVPNRSETKFHSANYWRQLNGCIALGQRMLDMDGDGYCDITNSKETMKQFHECFGDDREAILIIEGV